VRRTNFLILKLGIPRGAEGRSGRGGRNECEKKKEKTNPQYIKYNFILL
jgi:hypothetical protein